jgi:hypothetical protein
MLLLLLLSLVLVLFLLLLLFGGYLGMNSGPPMLYHLSHAPVFFCFFRLVFK